jgi:hypothetical protein
MARTEFLAAWKLNQKLVYSILTIRLF